jgi:hypothetical protein
MRDFLAPVRNACLGLLRDTQLSILEYLHLSLS